jgi:MFS family permease
MLLGRFIFGLGAESSFIAQDVVCVAWFSGRFLAFSMAMIGSFGCLGEILAFNTMSEIADESGDYKVALWFSFVMTLFSFLCGVVLCLLDRWGEKKVSGKHRKTGDIIKCADIKKFPKSYWTLVAMGVSFFCVIFPFISYSTDFLQEQRGFDEDEAGRYVSILSFVALFLGPPIGLLLDKIGKRAIAMSIGLFLTLPALFIMAHGSLNPAVVMVLMGTAYSFIPSVLWPSLALIVPEDKFATAYGLQMAVGNTALVFVYAFVGYVAEEYSIAASLMMMVAFAFMGFMMSLLWNYFDYYEMNSVANKPTPPEEDDEEDENADPSDLNFRKLG